MQQLLKILLLEDEPQDVEIQIRFLKENGLQFNYKVAEDKQAYQQALHNFKPDVILADHTLPLFNSEEALELMQQQLPGTVFVLLTGTVNEEFAASIIKKGADDYILKDRLTRLPAANKAALKHSNAEKEKKLGTATACKKLAAIPYFFRSYHACLCIAGQKLVLYLGE